MAVYIVWDYWRIKDIFYAIVYKDGELYFSETPMPYDLKGIKENG